MAPPASLASTGPVPHPDMWKRSRRRRRPPHPSRSCPFLTPSNYPCLTVVSFPWVGVSFSFYFTFSFFFMCILSSFVGTFFSFLFSLFQLYNCLVIILIIVFMALVGQFFLSISLLCQAKCTLIFLFCLSVSSTFILLSKLI